MTNDASEELAFVLESIDRVQIGLACQHCEVTMEFVEALVIEGVIEHQANELDDWHLTHAQYQQLRRAARLYQDLGINPPGIALALDLLTQLESYRR